MPKKHKANLGSLEILLENFSKQEIAEGIGVHVTTLNGWIKNKSMPHIASVACEGLTRRKGQEGKDAILFVIATTRDKMKFLSELLTEMGYSHKIVEITK